MTDLANSTASSIYPSNFYTEQENTSHKIPTATIQKVAQAIFEHPDSSPKLESLKKRILEKNHFKDGFDLPESRMLALTPENSPLPFPFTLPFSPPEKSTAAIDNPFTLSSSISDEFDPFQSLPSLFSQSHTPPEAKPISLFQSSIIQNEQSATPSREMQKSKSKRSARRRSKESHRITQQRYRIRKKLEKEILTSKLRELQDAYYSLTKELATLENRFSKSIKTSEKLNDKDHHLIKKRINEFNNPKKISRDESVCFTNMSLEEKKEHKLNKYKINREKAAQKELSLKLEVHFFEETIQSLKEKINSIKINLKKLK